MQNRILLHKKEHCFEYSVKDGLDEATPQWSITVDKEKAAEYAALQTSATGAAKRGYVDQIIEAADTRKYVIGAFEMLFTKREDRPSKKHGTV